MDRDLLMTGAAGWLIVSIIMRILPVGSIRGGLWGLTNPVSDTEREFLRLFTRRLFPLWVLIAGAVMAYAWFFGV